MMPIADFFDVVGPDAALDVAEIGCRRPFLSQEVSLEGRHPGVDEQQGRIILGHQRLPFDLKVTAALKKVEEDADNLFAADLPDHSEPFLH
jgi:hypothetical protein